MLPCTGLDGASMGSLVESMRRKVEAREKIERKGDKRERRQSDRKSDCRDKSLMNQKFVWW